MCVPRFHFNFVSLKIFWFLYLLMKFTTDINLQNLIIVQLFVTNERGKKKRNVKKWCQHFNSIFSKIKKETTQPRSIQFQIDLAPI